MMALQPVVDQAALDHRRLDDAEILEMVSHELSGRLMSLVGFSGRLASALDSGRLEVDENTRDSIETLHREALRMQSITSLFLELARLDHGLLEVDMAPVELTRLMEQEVARLRREYPDVAAHVERRPGPTIIESDERCVRQVLANLLDNAAKYGGTPPEVRVRIERDGGGWLVSVRDNGAGVSESDQQRIFDRFYRATSTSARRSGVGLGLYIARRLASQVGARLTVRNCGGAEFRLWLPDAPRTSEVSLVEPAEREIIQQREIIE